MKSYKILLFIIWHILPLCATAQPGPKHLVSNQDKQLLKTILDACDPCAIDLPDRSTHSRIKDEKIRSVIRYVVEAEMRYDKNNEDKLAIRSMREAINLLQLSDYPMTEAYLNYRLARMLYESDRSAVSVEHMLYAKEMLPEDQLGLMPYAGSFLSFLGSMYCLYGDYDLGLQYLHKSLQHEFCDDNDVYNMYGNLGLAYYKLGDADSSIWASERALQVAYKMKDSVEIGNMLGNLGMAYFLKKDFSTMIQYLQKDFDINSHLGEWQGATGALLMQAKTYLLLEKLDLAYDNLKRVDSIFKFCGCDIPASQREYYAHISSYYRQKGDFRSAVSYQDSFLKYMQITYNTNSSSILKSLELNVAGRIHEAKMKFLESERERQLLGRKIIVISSFFIFIIVVLLLYVQWKKRKTEQQVFRLKIDNAESRLKTYLENIKNKNKLLDQLNMELEKMRTYSVASDGSKEETADNDEIEILSKIKNASLITEESWLEFSELVELVHRNFFIRLRRKYTDLTPAEIRILTLIKLNFSTKEMAGMLGISPDSVRKAKYRLKRKFNLSDAQTLEDILMSL